MALPTQETFLADCWALVRARGEENPTAATRASVAWGFSPEGARCYSDEIVEIVAERDPSKRIVVMKLDTRNPVLCTDKTGAPYRWHGEAARVLRHVHVLALGLDGDDP